MTASTALDSADRSRYTCNYTPHPISIDAKLTEWQQAPAIALNANHQIAGAAKWNGPSDLSASVYALWDADFLYLACEVIDDEFHTKWNDLKSQSGDWLELIVYPDSAKFYDDSVIQRKYSFMLTAEGPRTWLKASAADSSAILDALLAIKSYREKKRTKIIYECALPLSPATFMHPPVQSACRLAISVKDDDGDGKIGSINWVSAQMPGKLVLEANDPGLEIPLTAYEMNRTAFDDFENANLRFGLWQPQPHFKVALSAFLYTSEDNRCIDSLTRQAFVSKSPALFSINWYTGLMESGHYRLAAKVQDSAGFEIASKDYPLFKYSSRHQREKLTRLERIFEQFQLLTENWTTVLNLPTFRFRLQTLRFEVATVEDESDIGAIETGLDSLNRVLEKLWLGEDPLAQRRGTFVKAYWSGIDDAVQPYVLFVPQNYKSTVRYPLMIWLDETDTDNPYSIGKQAIFPAQTADAGFIFARPILSRNLSDPHLVTPVVFSVIEDLQRHYSIDENRIFLYGAGSRSDVVWQIGLNFPDRLAGIVPIGGDPFIVSEQQWERAIFDLKKESKIAREKFRHLRWLTVAYFWNQTDSLLTEDLVEKTVDMLDKYDVQYFFEKFNTQTFPNAAFEALFDRLKQVTRQRSPEKISLICERLKVNRKYWLQADAFEKFYRPAKIDAEVKSNNRIKVDIENVWQYTLFLDSSLVASNQKLRVYTEGDLSYEGPVPENRQVTISFRRDSVEKKHRWQPGALDHFGGLAKSPEIEGPIFDAWCSEFLIVYDDINSTQADRDWEDMAHDEVRRWENLRFVRPRMKKASEMTLNDAKAYHLICFGFPNELPFLKDYPGWFPIKCDSQAVTSSEFRLTHKSIAAAFIYPNPLNRRRYVLINSGIARLTPAERSLDFIIIDRSRSGDDPRRVLGAGYFDRAWALNNELLWIYNKKEK
ncbi:hypothetical protein JXJ21_04570 [candidate division KSB1 bacterium]|nr:hypothetical protein [candidate division KSB1 bacterium]